MHAVTLLELLLLLMLANGTPVIAKRVLGARLGRPIDGGTRFFDGRPVFGSSKTIRGLILAVLVTMAGSDAIGLGGTVGAVVGAAAMAGDLFSSFAKRRLGLPPHSMALGLDQIPESLFPLLACQPWVELGAADVMVGVVAFLVGEVVLSRLLFMARIRDRPY